MWLRAAMQDPERRKTNLRYAIGVVLVQLGWVAMLAVGLWPLWGFAIMVALEMAVPVWAESARKTPWHPHHIAERYGLLTIIVIGESVLADTIAVQAAFGEHVSSGEIWPVIAGGLLLLFAIWWIYFSRNMGGALEDGSFAFLWGYGHYFVFASAAAIGAGIAVNVDLATHHAELSWRAAGLVVAIPTALYFVATALLQSRSTAKAAMHVGVHLVAAGFVIIAAVLAPTPLLWIGLIAALLAALLAAWTEISGRG